MKTTAKPRVTRCDLTGLLDLAEDLEDRCLHGAPARPDESIDILPVEEFLSDIWAGRLQR